MYSANATVLRSQKCYYFKRFQSAIGKTFSLKPFIFLVHFNDCFSVSLISLLHWIQFSTFVSFSLCTHIFKLPINLASTIKRCVCVLASRVGDKSVSMDGRFLGHRVSKQGRSAWRQEILRNLWLYCWRTNRSRPCRLFSTTSSTRGCCDVLPHVTTSDIFPGSSCSQSSVPLSAVTETISLCRVRRCLPMSLFLFVA